MITATVLATLLATFHQPYETRCFGSQFAVQDDIPPFGTIRNEGALVDANGQRVAYVFLMKNGHVYIQSNRKMQARDQVKMESRVTRGDKYSPVHLLRKPVSSDLRVERCAGR